MATFSENQGKIGAFFFVSLIGLLALRWVEEGLARSRKRRDLTWLHGALQWCGYDQWGDQFWYWARVVLLGVCVWIVKFIAVEMAPLLEEIWQTGGYLYVGLLFLAGVMLMQAYTRIREYSALGLDRALLIMMICMTMALVYLATLSFAYRIYPYIPEDRAGGDYTTAPSTVLSFDALQSNNVPAFLIDTNRHDACLSKPLIVLHENSTEFWVAVPFVAMITNRTPAMVVTNGPWQWRGLQRSNKPKLLFTVKRDAVVGREPMIGVDETNIIRFVDLGLCSDDDLTKSRRKESEFIRTKVK
jgi:hypothetical protein